MVAEPTTEGPIQAASAVGRMASGVEHAREGNSGERATLNHRQGLCVRSRVTGAGRRVRRGGAGSQGAFMNVCIGVYVCATRDQRLFAAVPPQNENHSILSGSFRTAAPAQGAMPAQA